MPAFTFHLQDGGPLVPAFEIQWLDADADALAYGRKLLSERPRYSSVAIVDGNREVGGVERNSSFPPGAPEHTLGA